MRPTTEKIIQKQIAQWESRVWMPDIKPDRIVDEDGNEVVINNEKYNEIYNTSSFLFIHAEEKETIYKFLRYGIEKNKIYNSNIIFARPSVFDAYIDSSMPVKESYNYCKEMLKVIEKDYKNKFVVCDDLNIEFYDKLAVYFISQLQSAGAKGIIFHCDKKLPNNLYSCIATSKAADILDI